MNIQPPTSKVESLRVFLDLIERHLRSLEVMGENINQHVFVSMIKAKLTEDVLRHLELAKGTKKEWSVDNLRLHLRDYVTACEKSEKKSERSDNYRGNQPVYTNKGRAPDRSYVMKRSYPSNTGSIFRPGSSAEALMTNEKQIRTIKQNKSNTPVCCFVPRDTGVMSVINTKL